MRFNRQLHLILHCALYFVLFHFPLVICHMFYVFVFLPTRHRARCPMHAGTKANAEVEFATQSQSVSQKRLCVCVCVLAKG